MDEVELTVGVEILPEWVALCSVVKPEASGGLDSKSRGDSSTVVAPANNRTLLE